MCADLLRPTATQALEFEVAEPHTIRDAAVAFWWERRQWPEWPIEQYYHVWDWRYQCLSEGPPRILIAREGSSGRILGHIAVYKRLFRLGDLELSVGVPSSLAIHADHMGGVAGARLTSFPSRQLRAGTYDVILGFANQIAHDLLLRLGAADLGRMASYADLHRTAGNLRRRARAAAAFAFVLDAGLAARRRWLRVRHHLSARFDVYRVTPDEFRQLDRSHWVAPKDRVVAADTAEYVARRYLECPYAERKAYALFEGGTGRCEGFVITEGDEQVELWSVQVNRSQLDVASAIVTASRAFGRATVLTASALPYSCVGTALSAAGFLRTRREQTSTYPRLVNAMVRPRHPLESQLQDFSRWEIWTGSSQY